MQPHRCSVIQLPSSSRKKFEIVGGAVIAIVLGMLITLFWKDKGNFEKGIKFTSKKILLHTQQIQTLLISKLYIRMGLLILSHMGMMQGLLAEVKLLMMRVI